MFSKNPGLKAFANTKSSEKRNIINGILDTYNVPEGLRSSFAVSTMKKATYKSENGNVGVIYADDNQIPIYFLPRDYKTPIPTIYTLWKNPALLPIVLTNSHVVNVIGRGANLMLPGTIPPFDSRCRENSVVGIADYSNPLVVVAVGKCSRNLDGIMDVQGAHGVAVTILHHFNDELTKIAKSNPSMPTNNELECLVASLSLGENEDSIPPADDSVATENSDVALEGALDNKNPKTYNKSDSALSKDKDSNNNNPEAVEVLSAEDISYFFKRAFLMTLYTEDVKPPISAATFVSNHLLKNLPIVPESLESQLSFKKSSWKKSTKFLKEMEKLGYLKTKGRDETLTIVELANKSTNEEVANFVAHRIKKASNHSNKSVSQQSDTASARKKGKITIVELYKANAKVRPLFEFCKEDYNAKFFDAKQVTNLLNKYIAGNNLINERNKKFINLNPFLQTIFKETRDKLPRDNKLTQLILANGNFMQYYTVLKDGTEENKSPTKGLPPKIKIISEYKMGRKIITRVSNFEHFGVTTSEELAQYLKVKCSGSTTVGPSKQNPMITEVMVQGPHIRTVYEFFVNQGVPAHFIETIDKVKKK